MVKRLNIFFSIITSVSCIFFVSSCNILVSDRKDENRIELTRTKFSELLGWKNASYSGALSSFLKSCTRFDSLRDNFNLGFPAGNVGKWREVCSKARQTKKGEERKFFSKNFTPYLASENGNNQGLFTGYYELELEGSRKKYEEYKYPIYKRPPEMSKPFLGRRRIGNGELTGRGLEIAYVKDPVELFFLHIQGSGRVRLENGKTLKVGYDDQNGCPYVSIGKYLADSGELIKEEITAQKIKDWLRSNPKKARQVMDKNMSYVFFREMSGYDSPVGGQGVSLTPEHSLAIDKRFIPYGVPLWLDTTLPAEGNKPEKPYRNLLIAQDTGGAIKGGVRGDIFFGHGKRASTLAGNMKQAGKYYLLLPTE